MKINTNYHTHSNFTDGASEIENIINKAISMGFREIGFSDHAAYFTDDKVSEYIKLVNNCKTKYKDKISILLAIECEFPVNIYGINLNKYINKLDYILFGNHFCFCYHELYQHVSNKFLTKSETNKFFESDIGKKHFKYGSKLYYSNLKIAVKNNKLMYFAHPDVYTMFYMNWNKELDKLTHKICKLCEKNKILLEINVKQGLRYGFRKEFWGIVKQYNLKTIVGLDYHKPTSGDFDTTLPIIVSNFIKELDLHPINVID